nr:MAG TPA: hypothetical protein [Caudoviricetes sp.]
MQKIMTANIWFLAKNLSKLQLKTFILATNIVL